MSEGEGSSGEEGSLQIDTEPVRRTNSERVKGRGGRSRGKGRKGRGGAKGSGQQPDPADSFKPGDVVWAKVMGFNFWPAKIFDAASDDVVPMWLKQPPKPSYILVRFFGTYDMQWVSPNSIESYDKGLNKRFQSKSKSKVFQKAVKEVFAYVNDSVMPEGLTLRPPDPPIDTDEEGGTISANSKRDLEPSLATSSSSYTVTYNPKTLQTTTASNGSTHSSSRGSSRRKSTTPRRLSSSSSDSQIKRPRLDSMEDGEEEKTLALPKSPEIQAFTCAPLPLITPSAIEGKPIENLEGTNSSANMHSLET